MDDLVDPLKSTLDFKMRSNAVKQEVEKNQELVRATLRCMVGLANLSDTGNVYKLLWAFFFSIYFITWGNIRIYIFFISTTTTTIIIIFQPL